MFRIAADVRTVPDRGRARIGAQGADGTGRRGFACMDRDQIRRPAGDILINSTG